MENKKMIKRSWIQRWFAANPLFFVAALPLCADLLFTLIGQGPAYWQNYHHVNESSPVSLLLEIHPLVYLLFVVLYISVIYQGIKRLKKPWNFVLTCMALIVHAYGSSTWVSLFFLHLGLLFFPQTTPSPTGELMLFRWSGTIFYLLFIGLCAGLALSAFQKKQR